MEMSYFGLLDLDEHRGYITSLSAISGLMLSHIRKAMGVAQSDMGKLFDMSHATYRSIEKGETAINADFIFMLCTIIEKRYSKYFELIEEIAEHLINIEKDTLNNDCSISIIPNGDFQKILKDDPVDGYSVIGDLGNNLPLVDQDIYLLLSPELRIKIMQLTDKVIMKDQVKDLIKITSNEVEDVVQALRKSELDDKGLNSISHEGTLSTAASIALYSTLLSPISLPVFAGLGLYKAYKKSKEQKKK
jgi:transcriptional regulator with XRE-family HTH domain